MKKVHKNGCFKFILIFILEFCTDPLQATSLKNKIKNAFKKVEKKVVTIAKSEANDLKKQGLSIKTEAQASAKAFKSGNIKEGFKDVGKVAYTSTNLATLGTVDSAKTGAQNIYQGAKAIAHGDKQGWKKLGEGFAKEASVAAMFVPGVGEEMEIGTRMALSTTKTTLKAIGSAPKVVKVTNKIVNERKVLAQDIKNNI